MELQLENDPLGCRVCSFVDNTVTIGEIRYTTSLIVTPRKVVCEWAPRYPEGLTVDDFEIILSLKPELILVGTGNALSFPDSVILKGVIRAGIGIDFMDSRAACRTYNLLAAEGRHVVAGIIIEQPTCANELSNHDDLFGR
jgi:uncharacterized protein